MASKWYVLHSKPNQEEFLRDQLATRHVEVYYPFLEVKPVNPRSRSRRAFFPGYLFIYVDLSEDRINAVMFLPGAANLVTFGGEAAIVPGNIIQAIRKKIELTNSKKDNPLDLNPGDLVTIREGLFEGYEGIVDARLSGAERVRIFLRLLQSKTLAVELPVKSVSLKKNGRGTK